MIRLLRLFDNSTITGFKRYPIFTKERLTLTLQLRLWNTATHTLDEGREMS
jgi:hypothetical protein